MRLVAVDIQLLLTRLRHSFDCGLLLIRQRCDIAGSAGVVVAVLLVVALTPLLYVAIDAGLFLTRLDDNRRCLACRYRYAVLSDATVSYLRMPGLRLICC